MEGAKRGRGIGESKRHKKIKTPLYKVACLSHRSSLARLLPRYALGSSPTVDPSSRSISRLLIRAKKSAKKVDTCLFLMVRLPC